MSTYRHTTTGEVREISDELIAAWEEVGNPKREAWEAYVPPTPEPPAPQPQWTAFGSVVMEQAEIKALPNQAFAIGESPLAMGLAVGLGKAADGDSSVFLDAWGKAVAGGLVPAELIAGFQQVATAYNLPEEFVGALDPSTLPSDKPD